MSTLVLPYQSGQTEQLYFPWAQPEHRTSKKRSIPSCKPQPRRDGQDNRIGIERPDRAQQSGSTSSNVCKADLVNSAVVLPTVLSRPLTKSTRVGEVRLGNVMLALLKQYGITDEEIEAGLATNSTAGVTAGTIGQPVPG